MAIGSCELGLDLRYRHRPRRGRVHAALPVFTGVLLAFQFLNCGLAGRHVSGFPGLGLLRTLRPIARPRQALDSCQTVREIVKDRVNAPVDRPSTPPFLGGPSQAIRGETRFP